MSIKKILIANRAEIAIRVISTCRVLGIKTVTLYSEEDKNLPHAYMSDESYCLGSGSIADTYLNQEKIIEIAKKSNTDAIHPGYGFLSENAEFAENLKKNGLIFIGPGIEAITLMGDKKTSKQKMEEIGIPLVPGYHQDDQDEKKLQVEANKMGYPLLIKATAGGGGKGMRIVREKNDFVEALAAAKREAKNAFGNDKVLLEKYIENPRHIEVQIVSDGKGNTFHFFERECSIQRRYQKIIEETPSPALTDELRKNICETAVNVAAGINYLGAGTIEFILASNNEFYFLEMNTRLQVEHPVTEMVTGVDLVALQISAAAGEGFDFNQSDITQTGHALECRIYAENPDNDFLPSIGKIQSIGSSKLNGVRLDTGYRDGNEVTTSYDPMLAKLIVHSENREFTLKKMNKALNDITFSGLTTNRDYLRRVLMHPKFIEGKVDTHFIETYEKDLSPTESTDDQLAQAIAVMLTGKASRTPNSTGEKLSTAWDNINSFRNV